MPTASETNYYSVTKHTHHVELHIYTGSKTPGNITVQFGAGLIPDNTNEFMRDWVVPSEDETSGGSGTLTGLTVNSHYTLIFFGSRDAVAKTEITGNKIIIGS